MEDGPTGTNRSVLEGKNPPSYTYIQAKGANHGMMIARRWLVSAEPLPHEVTDALDETIRRLIVSPASWLDHLHLKAPQRLVQIPRSSFLSASMHRVFSVLALSLMPLFDCARHRRLGSGTIERSQIGSDPSI